MRTYILKRLLLFIPTAFGVSIIIFVMLHTIPGDYATALFVGGEGTSMVTLEDIQEVREQLGLDGNLAVQYANWLGDFFQGDFGTSWNNRRPVIDRMLPRIVVSFELGLLAVTIACVMGTVGGIICAVRQDSWIDYVCRGTSMALQAMPSFWLALMVVVALVVTFAWLPPIGYRHIWEDPVRNISVLLLPAFVVGLRSSAEILRMTRSSVLEVLREDYVRTAESKGLHRPRILGIHVLRNALLPVVTLAGFEVVFLMSGQIMCWVFQISIISSSPEVLLAHSVVKNVSARPCLRRGRVHNAASVRRRRSRGSSAPAGPGRRRRRGTSGGPPRRPGFAGPACRRR